ncbi:hypothetical protein GCM10025768_25350 [Microbacterium pseudoresistens]|uniref:DUF4190 domain-containing protein n=1 Tax=Microbacterium pseudoresistens TaxID=640634 RepID=A0A7Y9EWX8_9MICO|nr:DUF4190 domain-containing protein [Microbacterium pseudoresistens]NYD55256.1 hypothetical protein [Microbacterium pseudoresistens]
MTIPEQPGPDSVGPAVPPSDVSSPHPVDAGTQGIAAPQYPPHQHPAYPAPEQAAAPSAPGSGMAIAGFVLAIIVPIVGLILSIVAFVKLKKANAPRGLAIAGIIIGALLTLAWIVGIVAIGFAIAGLAATCAELGPGVWDVNGVTYTCG